MVNGREFGSGIDGRVVDAQGRQDAAETQLRHQNLHDPLTGLPNRTLLVELLDRAVERARRSHDVAAVLFIDLDAFESINDLYAVGDELLVAVAGRLATHLRPGDALCRTCHRKRRQRSLNQISPMEFRTINQTAQTA